MQHAVDLCEFKVTEYIATGFKIAEYITTEYITTEYRATECGLDGHCGTLNQGGMLLNQIQLTYNLMHI